MDYSRVRHAGHTFEWRQRGGKNHGSWHSSLAAGRTDSGNHSACAVVALKVARMAVHPAAAIPAIPVSETAPDAAPVSAVSWAAIFAGAVTAAAVSLLLAALGTGLGFASISAWPNSGASVATFSIMTAVWLIVMQWVASGVGGFLTGRLRTKWTGVHTHEVFFRDTAHGFVMWAFATVITVAVVTFAAAGVAREGTRAASTVAAGAMEGAAQNASTPGSVSAYSVDSLLRTSPSTASSGAGNPAETRAEATRILATAFGESGVSAPDKTYLAQLVASRTGLSEAEAEQRVDTVIAQVKAAEVKARQAAEAARKVAATTSIFTALAMLVGAFIACVAAALGGRERDLHI
jgi:hypothetical protein